MCRDYRHEPPHPSCHFKKKISCAYAASTFSISLYLDIQSVSLTLSYIPLQGLSLSPHHQEYCLNSFLSFKCGWNRTTFKKILLDGSMIKSTCCSIMKTRVQIPTPISSSSQCLWLQAQGTHALFSPAGHRHLHIHLNQTLKEIIDPIAIPQPDHESLPHEGSILPSSRQLSLGSELDDYSMIPSLSRHKSLALAFGVTQ